MINASSFFPDTLTLTCRVAVVALMASLLNSLVPSAHTSNTILPLPPDSSSTPMSAWKLVQVPFSAYRTSDLACAPRPLA
jgi:hypothetical protein